MTMHRDTRNNIKVFAAIVSFLFLTIPFFSPQSYAREQPISILSGVTDDIRGNAPAKKIKRQKLPLKKQAHTVDIDASPQIITNGESSLLTWTSENAPSASIDQGIGSVDAIGSLEVFPTQTTTYTITTICEPPTGTATDSVFGARRHSAADPCDGLTATDSVTIQVISHALTPTPSQTPTTTTLPPETTTTSTTSTTSTTTTSTTTTTIPSTEDTTSPSVTITNPVDGSRDVSTTPNIEITYSDTDSGINTSTLVIKIDSVDYTNSFDITSTKASFQVTNPFDSTHIITASISDNNGNNASASSTFAVPDSIVPIIEPLELDTTVSTSMGSATEFLYTGDDPVQTGVGTDTIKAYRCAVLRGMVKDSDDSPIKGVTVTILDHEEFGSTTTRVDGMFDMAVNGGSYLTVDYKKDGYLPVQRQVDAPWEDYAWVSDVVMVAVDSQVTTIDLSASTEMQAAQGSEVIDEDGTRTATLFFPQGVTAEMTLPGGTTQSLDTLNVRITEYTVGENGPKKMPAALPANSAYTYCVEYSVDEAVAAGATKVSFDNPLIHYVENFLNYPVGTNVPVGYYDEDKGQWIPSDNGRIVKIMSITGGKADIDTDGDDVVDNGVGTADDGGDMGITDEERTRVASLYTTGKTLWRVPVTHFSAWDCNWGFGPPDDATTPNQPPPKLDDKKESDTGCGSIIGIQKQTLGEEVGITGTPFSLHYQSNRTSGNLIDYSLNIPLSGTSTPAMLQSIELEVFVAGRKFTKSFVAAQNLTYTFTWDGMDAYGRTMQGQQPVTVRIAYNYAGVVRATNRFGYNGGGKITGSRTRREVALWQEWNGFIAPWDNLKQGLGGWTMGIHHTYDLSDGTVWYGDGTSHNAQVVFGAIITTVAGGGSGGDGGLATQARLSAPEGSAVGGDGRLYIAEANNRIRRVGTDGIITTVAGNGTGGYSGDGGQATQAKLGNPYGVAVGGDGSLYIADTNNRRIRRVGTDGIITTVAGNANAGYSGDGGLATQAKLYSPDSVVVGGDGSLYIADLFNRRIRRVGTDGIITTVAGNGISGYSGDGGVPTQAKLGNTHGVAVGVDGSLYIADLNNGRIRKVAPPSSQIGNGEIAISSEDGSEVYIFDVSGRHLRTQNAFTNATIYEFQYNGNGYLTSITDGDGNVTTIERDGDGNPTAIVAPFGQRTTLELNAGGYLAKITNPAGETIQFGYTTKGLLTNLTDARSNVKSYTYDAMGRLTKDEDPVGGFTALDRTETGNDYEVTKTTAEGIVSTYKVEHLSTGEERRTNSLCCGNSVVIVTGTDGSTKTTYPDGTLMSILQGPDPRFSMAAPVLQNVMVTTPKGLVQKTTGTRTVTLSDPNDPFSLLTQTDTRTINGRIYKDVYNATARTITSTSPVGRVATTTMDEQGRLTKTEASGLATVSYDYDTQGLLTTLTVGTDTDARVITFSYNSDGHLDTVTNPLSQNALYEYDGAGRVTKKILPDNSEIGLGYDTNGNTTSVTPPEKPDHTFSYTAVNLRETYNPPALSSVTTQTQYEYNLDKKLHKITRPDGNGIQFDYNSKGKLELLTLPDSETVEYTYDDTKGQLTTITAPGGETLSFTYDGSLALSTTWAGAINGSVSQTYNNNFWITSNSVNGGSTIAYQYDNDGLLTGAGNLTISRNAQNGLITGATLGSVNDTRGYNAFGEIVDFKASYNAAEKFSTQFTRDKLGRITEKTEAVDGATNVYNYEYDATGRLIKVKKDSVIISEYTYDSNGNRNSHNAITGAYDAQDRLITYGNNSYTYTANGELLTMTDTSTSETTAYTYDVLGNLKSVTLPDGKQIEYVIDGNNRRIGKKVNGSLTQGFLYQSGLRPIAELDNSGAIISRFVYATHINVPDYMIRGGTTYRIITDHLGSPRLVVNTTNGVIEQRMDYDAFGNVTNDTNPGFQPFGFAGGIYDSDTGLVRFGARDYDAETGRWTAKDPIGFAGGDTNLYRYVMNNPVNIVDPMGKNWVAIGVIFDFYDGSTAGPVELIGTVGGTLFGAYVGAYVGTHFLSPVAGARIGAIIGGIIGGQIGKRFDPPQGLSPDDDVVPVIVPPRSVPLPPPVFPLPVPERPPSNPNQCPVNNSGTTLILG